MSKLFQEHSGQPPLTREEEYLNLLDEQIDIEKAVLSELVAKYDSQDTKREDEVSYDQRVRLLKQINSRKIALQKKEDKLSKLLEVYADPYNSPLPYRQTRPKNTAQAIKNLLALGSVALYFIVGIIAVLVLLL